MSIGGADRPAHIGGIGDQVIGEGAEGRAHPVVHDVQQALNRLPGMAKLAEDGVFNAETSQALRQFQHAQGLAVTGAINQPTIDALNQALPAVQKPVDAQAGVQGAEPRVESAGADSLRQDHALKGNLVRAKLGDSAGRVAVEQESKIGMKNAPARDPSTVEQEAKVVDKWTPKAGAAVEQESVSGDKWAPKAQATIEAESQGRIKWTPSEGRAAVEQESVSGDKWAPRAQATIEAESQGRIKWTPPEGRAAVEQESVSGDRWAPKAQATIDAESQGRIKWTPPEGRAAVEQESVSGDKWAPKAQATIDAESQRPPDLDQATSQAPGVEQAAGDQNPVQPD